MSFISGWLSTAKVFAAKTGEKAPSYGINIQQLVSMITMVVITVVVVLIAFSVYRIIKLKLTRKVLFPITTFLLVVVVVLNLAINHFSLIINTSFSKQQVDQHLVAEARQSASALTEMIESEGLVLLENKKEALPLEKGNLNVFGYSSRSVVYGGSGSGGGAENDNVDLQEGLENAGFKVNDDLTKFYDDRFVPREKINIHKLVGGDFNSHEPVVSEYSERLLIDAKEFSQTALVVFSRNSGEGADITTDMAGYSGGSAGNHYLELTDDEEAMLHLVKENFGKVIVLINSSYPMELGFLKDDKIAGALWIGNPGSVGFNAVGKALSGEINPSGRLADTYAYDATSAPSYFNIGEFPYENSDFKNKKETWHYKYIDYAEGIYVGYRYYETRFVDNQTGQTDEKLYGETVQYPFGYGLSYSKFQQEITDYQSTDTTISLTINVTNTGKIAGKNVVQLYYTAPYIIGGIEKSHVVLAGFAKTKKINPGESESVNLQLAVEDMASYDDKKEQAYVLEKGDYQIKLMGNAHEVIEAKSYVVPKTIVYNQENKRASDQVVATNQFDDNLGEVTYVSRSNWEGTLPTEMAKPKKASKELLAALQDFSIKEDKEAKPIVKAKHGLTLYELRGVAFDDPKWEQLLEQLSVKDMEKLISYGGFSTVAINSIKKPATIDSDGPAGINHLISGAQGNQYTSEVVMASTWNQEIANQMGQSIANEAKASNITGLYLPGVNIHRSPFAGRNFEYFSEDSLLSGKIGMEVVKGASQKGSYSYMKHFAMYDQETKRYEYPTGAATWSTEQSMREIYLKPFEIAVKEGETRGIMSSYNRLGAQWVGVSEALLQRVLRDEWGFRGSVITDYYKPQYMNIDQSLAAGNDLVLYLLPTKLKKETTATNWGQQNMRKASHNILYTMVNSHAYDVVETKVPNWILLYSGLNVLLIGTLGFGMMAFTNSKKLRKKKELARQN